MVSGSHGKTAHTAPHPPMPTTNRASTTRGTPAAGVNLRFNDILHTTHSESRHYELLWPCKFPVHIGSHLPMAPILRFSAPFKTPAASMDASAQDFGGMQILRAPKGHALVHQVATVHMQSSTAAGRPALARRQDTLFVWDPAQAELGIIFLAPGSTST